MGEVAVDEVKDQHEVEQEVEEQQLGELLILVSSVLHFCSEILF